MLTHRPLNVVVNLFLVANIVTTAFLTATFITPLPVYASPQSGCTVTIDRITRTENSVKVDLLIQNHRAEANSGQDVINSTYRATLSSNNSSPGSVNSVETESPVIQVRPNSTGSTTLIFTTSGSWSPQSSINITPSNNNPPCTYPNGSPLVGTTQTIDTQCTNANGCFEDTTDPDYQGEVLSPECQFINSRRSTTRYTNAEDITYNYQGQSAARAACIDNRSTKDAGVIFLKYDDNIKVYADYTNHSQNSITIGQIHYDCPNGKIRMVLFNSCSNLEDFSLSLYEWATYIAIFIAIVAYIRGGFMYVTSRGDPSKTAEAKGVLTTAGIGLVLIVVALVIVQVLGSSLSGTGWGINLTNFLPQ